jgi:arsenate reductase
MIKIYHNNRCTKSRNVLQILQQEKIEFEIINYLEKKPSSATLKKLVQKAGIKPEELIRKNEAIYKEQFKGQNKSDEEWIAVLVAHPILIERPIVETETKAMVCRPAELVYELLKQ